MLPLDSEFIILYLLYLSVFGYFLFQYLHSRKRVFKINLFLFFSYFTLMSIVFADAENFKYGNSLAVLFYGFLFVILHLTLWGMINLFKWVFKKNSPL
jgi:hypothetical protein